MGKSLMVLTVVASLLISSIGMAEARNHKYNDNVQYSQNYNNSHHQNHSQYNNYYRPNKHHRIQQAKHHRNQYIKRHCHAQHVKHHHRHHHNNRYLYPALIGAGVGLLVLGLTRQHGCSAFAVIFWVENIKQVLYCFGL